MKFKLSEYNKDYEWNTKEIVEFNNFEDAVRDYAENYIWTNDDGCPSAGDTIGVYVLDIENNIISKYKIEIKKVDISFNIKRLF